MIKTLLTGAVAAVIACGTVSAPEPPSAPDPIQDTESVSETVTEDFTASEDVVYYEETYSEQESYEEDYEGASYEEEDAITADESTDLETMGVIYDGDTRYTWYSERVLPGGGLTELNESGRYTDEEGFVRDGDGFIAVASSDHEIGTELDTPWGAARVYDSGCDSGTVDVYTGW